MIHLLSKGKLVAILRNEGKWEILICLNENLKIIKINYEKSINHLLKQISNYYHRPYKEELKLIEKEFDIHRKIPIFIKMNEILLFPIRSFEHENCILLNYYCIQKFIKKGKDTYVELCIPLMNHKIILDQGLLIPCDRRIINKQYRRCENIDYTLRERSI